MSVQDANDDAAGTFSEWRERLTSLIFCDRLGQYSLSLAMSLDQTLANLFPDLVVVKYSTVGCLSLLLIFEVDSLLRNPQAINHYTALNLTKVWARSRFLDADLCRLLTRLDFSSMFLTHSQQSRSPSDTRTHKQAR